MEGKICVMINDMFGNSWKIEIINWMEKNIRYMYLFLQNISMFFVFVLFFMTSGTKHILLVHYLYFFFNICVCACVCMYNVNWCWSQIIAGQIYAVSVAWTRTTSIVNRDATLSISLILNKKFKYYKYVSNYFLLNANK